jgi:beta-glucosidase
VQEGARRFRISGGSAAVSLSTADPVDIGRETNGDVMLLVTLKMTKAPETATIEMQDATKIGKVAVSIPPSARFVRYGLSLKCLRDTGVDMSKVVAPFIFETEGAADYQVGEVRLGTDAEQVLPCK